MLGLDSALSIKLIYEFEFRGRYPALGHFSFRIFSNYFSQKFTKIKKKTVWKSNNLTMYGNFWLDLY